MTGPAEARGMRVLVAEKIGASGVELLRASGFDGRRGAPSTSSRSATTTDC